MSNRLFYALALKYDADTMIAPQIVAKGKNDVADRIKKIAKEHNVPIIKNSTLVNSLYYASKVGEFIQKRHYKAVGEIIHYVYSLKKKKL